MNKELMVDEFITHNLPFDQINEGFTLMLTGKRYSGFLSFIVSFLINFCNFFFFLVFVECAIFDRS